MTASHNEQIWALIDRDREACVGLLKQLVQQSHGGEEAVAGLIASCFRELGCQVEVIGRDPRGLTLPGEFAAGLLVEAGERLSVVGRALGKGVGRSLMLFAHPDGEPFTGTEGWSHPPFAGDTEDGRLYGWGAADDLLGVATMISALRALVDAGLTPLGDVILASTASKRHAQGIIAALDRGYVAEGAVYLHPAESGAGLCEIKAFTLGMLRFRIRVPGHPPDTAEPNHTSLCHLSVSPIDKAWIVLHALNDLAADRASRVHHHLLDEAVGRSTNLLIHYLHCGEEGGESRVGAECVLEGAISFPPGETIAQVQKEVATAVEKSADQDEWLRTHRPKLDWLTGTWPAEVAAVHPLYRAVSDAVESVTGVEPKVYPLHAGSDIRNPILYKAVPTVGLGSLCGDLSQAGGCDEWVDLDDYIRAVKVCASIIVNWCGVETLPAETGSAGR